MNRNEILQEIERYSPDEQKEQLKKFLSLCTTFQQWQAFTVCHHRQVGKFSYQSVRVWTFRKA